MSDQLTGSAVCHRNDPGCPLFSVITINYNNISGLRATVQSVLNQNSTDYELIVIDGASTDGSKEYLDEIREQLTLAVSEKDNGIYHAMNKGAQSAQGKFLIFMNSGDCFAQNNILALVANALENEGTYPDFIYGDSFEERSDGKGLLFKKAKPHSMFWYGMFTQHQSMFFSRRLVDELELRFDERYSLAADWDFVVRFLRGIQDSRGILQIHSPISIFAKRGASGNYRKAIEEQFVIRRNVLKWSLGSCALLAALHLLLNMLRNCLPAAYYGFNKLRSIGYIPERNGKRDKGSV